MVVFHFHEDGAVEFVAENKRLFQMEKEQKEKLKSLGLEFYKGPSIYVETIDGYEKDIRYVYLTATVKWFVTRKKGQIQAVWGSPIKAEHDKYKNVKDLYLWETFNKYSMFDNAPNAKSINGLTPEMINFHLEAMRKYAYEAKKS